MVEKVIAGKLMVEISEETERNGFIIPDSKHQKGTVLISGMPRGDEIVEPQPSDKVIFQYNAGVEITLHGKKCRLIDIRDVICYNK